MCLICLVRAFGFITLRNFSITASLDKCSTNLTSRAFSFVPTSVVSEAVSLFRFAGRISPGLVTLKDPS